MEGLAVLLNDVWFSVVVEFGYVSSRILLVKFLFTKSKSYGVFWIE